MIKSFFWGILLFAGLFGSDLSASGSLRVTINPSGARTAGAQWRVDAGKWRSSGNTVQNVSAGQHTVDFQVASGWINPASLVAAVSNGATASPTVTYIKAAEVTFQLSPATAQWRIDGGEWYTSGSSASNLAPGVHQVEYASQSGFLSPATETIALTAGQVVSLTRNYTSLAQVSVALDPLNARWNVDGGSWLSSGASASVLPGEHALAYEAIAGFIAPSPGKVVLSAGQMISLNETYVKLAHIKVTLTPSTAQWRVNGGEWLASGAEIELSPGSYTLDYTSVTGYLTAPSENIDLAAGQLAALSRDYIVLSHVSVTLVPAAGQWRVNAGAWLESGASLSLPPGNYFIEYSPVDLFEAPAAETVTGDVALTRSYTPQTASLQIVLSHKKGQWRVDGGLWQSSGATVSSLAIGNHAVEYSSLPYWSSPLAETVILAGRQSLSLTRDYIQLAQIFLNLVPSTQQWRINGGAWQSSGTSLEVMPGDYLLEFSPLDGYDAPASQTLNLAPAGIFAGTLYYTSQKPTLRVHLTPSTGQWRIDGGEWQASGVQLKDVEVGTHTLEYSKEDELHDSLPSESIALGLRENPTLYRYYPVKPASVSVTLNPPGARWRVYPGDTRNANWQNSGATVGGLLVGNYTIEYEGVTNYDAPLLEKLTLSPAQVITLNRAYIPHPAQVTVTLNPLTAQWRIDGGAWNASGAVVANLSAGSHVVEFSELAGYTTPAALSVVLTPGDQKNYDIKYVVQPPAYSVIKGFSDFGMLPAVAVGRDGWLYAGTNSGGSYLLGLIFKIRPDGTGCTVIKQFAGGFDPTNPTALIEGVDGVLYGVGLNTDTPVHSTLFKINKDGTGLKTLYTFQTAPSNTRPVGIMQATDGRLYGATAAGNSPTAQGVIFRINVDGSGYTVLQALPASTKGVLVEGGDGRLYGTTNTGGTSGLGTIFALNKDGTGYIQLKSFSGVSDGATPVVGLLMSQDGMLYGTASAGGNSGRGVAFRLNLDGSGFAVLKHFSNAATDSARPQGLVEDASGNLYGTAGGGGAFARGTIYQLKKDGSGYTVLKHFSAGLLDGGLPGEVLSISADGTLYGYTRSGGLAGIGQIFSIRTDGTSFTTLKNLGAPDGNTLFAPVMEASDGILYGTTYSGGLNHAGTIYKVNKDGSAFSILHHITKTNDPISPFSGVIEGSNGFLYGASQGAIFKLSKDGTIYQSFSNLDTAPWYAGNLLEASDGLLYGAAASGPGGSGYIYSMTKDGTNYTVLHSFSWDISDGKTPNGYLIEASDGRLYGTTTAGGGQGLGTIFGMNKDGSGYTLMVRFQGTHGDGAKPWAGLIQGGDGALYGTTTVGGDSGFGTIFKINPDGSGYRMIKSFDGGSRDGQYPNYAGLVEKNSKLYGVTANGGVFNAGVLFRINNDGTDFKVLINFGAGDDDAASPTSGLFLGRDGVLYGTTVFGGGGGTVFRLQVD